MKRKISLLVALIVLLIASGTIEAKKYKFQYCSHPYEVFTTGQGQNKTQLVKAWAVDKSADKAIEQAKLDAVAAALFTGIGYDESTHGMGVSNLGALVTKQQYDDNKLLFDNFFKKGEFMKYVGEINSSYPSGSNNMAVPGGRRIGINLRIDYPGLRQWLKDNGIVQGVGGHFK